MQKNELITKIITLVKSVPQRLTESRLAMCQNYAVNQHLQQEACHDAHHH